MMPRTNVPNATCAAPLVVTAAAGTARAAIALGETVVVLGLGPVGQLVVQYAVAHGASRVIAVDTDARRLGLARTSGASDLLAVTAADARAAVADLTGGRLAEVVFDVTGNPAVLSQAVRLARTLGRVVLLGDTPTPSRQMLGPGVVSNSLTSSGRTPPSSPTTRQPARSTATRWPTCTSAASPPARSAPPE
ncbi:zinc-binding dehydrogenase [Nonomuraea sp. NPDC049758]|uniref:zinc-binding dehydrogenase n=1 Tax=Nonomuraea sp. NPDC049758 TaxID=3154360 RepID=UPI0034327F3B